MHLLALPQLLMRKMNAMKGSCFHQVTLIDKVGQELQSHVLSLPALLLHAHSASLLQLLVHERQLMTLLRSLKHYFLLDQVGGKVWGGRVQKCELGTCRRHEGR